MQLPHSKTRASYIEQIKIIEANLKDATSGEKSQALLLQVQKRLDAVAEKYQYSEELGTGIYKLYELQALVHYFNKDDDSALDFINQAIETRGENYVRAEKIKKMILEKGVKESRKLQKSENLPLELQALIKGQRSSAIIMAILSIISVYFIPWAIFYIILAVKLNPRRIPNKGLIKAAAILTIPLCCGLIPIIIDIEFWRMNKQIKEYENKGDELFMSDEKWLAGEPKRKRGRRVALSILITFLLIIFIFVCLAISQNSSSSSTDSSNSLLLTNTQFTPYTSVEHGFSVDFPGLPETERETIEASGYSIPYTSYMKDTANGEVIYLVAVYDYSGIELNESGALEGAVNGAVQNTQGASLISSEFSTYSGLNAIDAHYTAPVEGKTYDGYMKGFIKSGKMYAIFTIGANKYQFDDFMTSFNFT